MIPAKVMRDFAASGESVPLSILTFMLQVAKQGKTSVFFPLAEPCNEAQKMLINYGYKTELRKEQYGPGYVLGVEW